MMLKAYGLTSQSKIWYTKHYALVDLGDIACFWSGFTATESGIHSLGWADVSHRSTIVDNLRMPDNTLTHWRSLDTGLNFTNRACGLNST